jgi:hypothetical protein
MRSTSPMTLEKPMAIRTKVACAAMTIVAVLGAVLAASPAQAAGGGCNTTTSGYGWNVGVCSGDNGVDITGDFYVNVIGYHTGFCTIYGWQENTSGQVFHSHYYGCVTGHRVVDSTSVSYGPLRTHVRVEVVTNGTTYVVFDGVSPWSW